MGLLEFRTPISWGRLVGLLCGKSDEVFLGLNSQTSPPDGSDTDTEDLTIQPGSSVKFQVRDNNPGLFIATSKNKSWTPIAARTKAHVRTYAKPVK